MEKALASVALPCSSPVGFSHDISKRGQDGVRGEFLGNSRHIDEDSRGLDDRAGPVVANSAIDFSRHILPFFGVHGAYDCIWNGSLADGDGRRGVGSSVAARGEYFLDRPLF